MSQTLELRENEIEEIRKRLQSYLDEEMFKREDRLSKTYTFRLDGQTQNIDKQDNYTIYKAVHSGDENLKKLACKVITTCTYAHFMKYFVDVVGNTNITHEDKEDAVQTFFGEYLSRVIDAYDPDKGGLINYLDYSARTVFRNFKAKKDGASSKQAVTNTNRIIQIIENIRRETGNTNPSAAEIREYDIRSGRSQPLSIKTIQRYLDSPRKADVSIDILQTGGMELAASQQYNPYWQYINREDDTTIRKALARMAEKYRMVIIKALELDISNPRDENRQLIEYVRKNVLRDERATDDRVRAFIEHAYAEFQRAWSAIRKPRLRHVRERSILFERIEDDDIIEQEIMDIKAAIEEDPFWVS